MTWVSEENMESMKRRPNLLTIFVNKLSSLVLSFSTRSSGWEISTYNFFPKNYFVHFRLYNM